MKRVSYSEFSDWWRVQTGSAAVTANAVEVFIDKRLATRNQPLPIDPSVYAQRLGCTVSLEDIPAGRLEISPTSTRIRLPQHHTSEKQRFSAAHELAHLLLLDCEGAIVRRPFRLSSGKGRLGWEQYVERTRLERLCDWIARVMLVPSDNLRERFSSQEPLTFSSIADLAKEFDVPIHVLFERLADDGYISKYPGHILLHYALNKVTSQEAKWRVAASAVPAFGPAKKLPFRNQSFDKLGITLPPPEEIKGTEGQTFNFSIGASKWTLRVQHFEPRPVPWLLVSIELSHQGLSKVQRCGNHPCQRVKRAGAL